MNRKATRILKMQKEEKENKRKRMLKKNMKNRLQKKCQLSGRFKRNQKRERDQKNQINQGSNLKQWVLSDPNNKKKKKCVYNEESRACYEWMSSLRIFSFAFFFSFSFSFSFINNKKYGTCCTQKVKFGSAKKT